MVEKIKIVTHNSNFHTDDIFAVAALLLVLGEDNIEIIRSRDIEVITKGDYVVDVGGIHDPEKNLFDHHQTGGAGKRENNLPYAAFGLVWKKFGAKICGDQAVAEAVDQMLVQPIDAKDNGVEISETIFRGIYSFDLGTLTTIFRPTWREEESLDNVFVKLVSYAKSILERQIVYIKDGLLGSKLVMEAYNQAEDKRVIFLDEKLPWIEVLSKVPEPLFVIYPKPNGYWSLKCVRLDPMKYEVRRDLPIMWGGKNDEELEKVTGVKDVLFCHKGLFTAGAKSKEAITKMAEIALNS